MSASVDISEKKRAMEADSISQEAVEVKKRKLGREEEKEEDVETEKMNNGREEEDVEADKRNNGMEVEEEEDAESKKRSNGREGEQEEDGEAEKMNNGKEEGKEEDGEAEKMNNGREEGDVEAEKRNLSKAKPNESSIVLVPGAELIFSDPKAFFASIYKDEEKPAPKVEIPTLDRFRPPTIFRTRELIPIREPGSKAVLSAAKSLLWVSSSVGGEPLKRCSGFWIDWDEGTKTGTVLTTAHLIRTKDAPGGGDVWTDGAHYDSDANITVHLLDGTSAEGQLLYHQPHYDLAFLSVKVDQPVQLPSFNEGVKFSQKVFRLGRDKLSKLRITYGRAVYMNPDMYERYHNMYFNCGDCDSDDDDDGDDDNECDDGGLVVDLDGEVVGMVNNSETLGSFIPSSILLKCVASWKNEGRILRPHLGMLFEAIKLLKPAYADNIWRAYNIDDGLIVQEVSKGSHAEKIGIERGDIIESLNGRCISTTVELENLLMSMSKDPLDSQNGLKNEVIFSVGVFHALKKQRRTVLLNANVSDCGEVIVKSP